MKKHIVYLLAIIALPIIASCSKEQTAPEAIAEETQISNETGISFINSPGFEADNVIFKLKSGTGVEKEYGQSLKGYNYTKLQEGAKTIYQVSVFKDGEKIPFNAYSKEGSGTKKELKSTSVVVLKENQVFEIVLE